jgi:hypothetical protein
MTDEQLDEKFRQLVTREFNVSGENADKMLKTMERLKKIQMILQSEKQPQNQVCIFPNFSFSLKNNVSINSIDKTVIICIYGQGAPGDLMPQRSYGLAPV